MATVTQYKVRLGRAMPKLCSTTGTSKKIIQFRFGGETQEVLTCNYDTKIVKSEDACLASEEADAYYATNYKAHPVKVEGELVYQSVIQKPVVLHETVKYGCTGTGGGGSTGSPVAPD